MSDMLLSFGGPVLDEDGRTVRVNNPVNAAALGFFSELMSKGLDAYPRPAPNALQQFLSGRVAMAGLGVFTVPNLRSTAEFSWDAELFPVFEGRREALSQRIYLSRRMGYASDDHIPQRRSSFCGF